ncbi:MarR family winged helix-turn-helix transcriptional regulator [Streptomyces sp. NPDC014734]|uniref:MarR family winged helix-turn-helix transcriptional regulator n=1 Tax=Streptomyces sp. NPDC014734 TaxID=3364886 RepID=UPI003702FC0B
MNGQPRVGPGAPAPPPDRDETAARLRPAVVRLAHGLRAPAERHGLTPSRLTALGVLSAHGPLRIGDLARGMGIGKPSASRLVDILVAAGLVGRRPDPHDQRASLIALTPAGTAVLDSIRRDSLQALASLVAELPDDRRAVLADAVPLLDSLARRLAPDYLPAHELATHPGRRSGRRRTEGTPS